uniref:Uncharacterized protein n=1 Tax=Anguilla anguilla TaxID=7936 RepID=A0A0E9U9X2_ANGAN
MRRQRESKGHKAMKLWRSNT